MAKALALAAQLGFAIACPMVAFIGGGAWLDSQLGTVPWLLFLGIILGVLAAGGALYQLTAVQGRKSPGGTTPKAPYKVERRTKDLGTGRADKRQRDGLNGKRGG